MIKIKNKEKTTHVVIVQSLLNKEKAGYIPLISDLSATEIADNIKKLLDEQYGNYNREN